MRLRGRHDYDVKPDNRKSRLPSRFAEHPFRTIPIHGVSKALRSHERIS